MSCKLDKVLGVINDVAGGIKNPAALAEIDKLKNALTQFAVSMETKKKEVDIARIIGKKVDEEVKSPQAIKQQLNELKSVLTEATASITGTKGEEGDKKLITEVKNTTKKEIVQDESSIREELMLVLNAYGGSNVSTTGGGYIANIKQKNGYLEANMDEDVAAGTIEKGINVSNVKNMLPKVNGNVINSYKKAYDKYYSERNRSKAVVSKVVELIELLESIKNDPIVAEALGIKANIIEEVSPLIPINKINPQMAKELQGCNK